VNWRIELPWRPASFVGRLDAGGFHQSCHVVLAAEETSIDKVSHYARRTLCAIAGLMAALDCVKELGTFTFVRPCWPAEPVVKAAARYAKQTAHRSRLPDGSIFGDEAILHSS